jgi:hypothetical protein
MKGQTKTETKKGKRERERENEVDNYTDTIGSAERSDFMIRRN